MKRCTQYPLHKKHRLPSLEELSIEEKIAQVLGYGLYTQTPIQPGSFNKIEAFAAKYGLGCIHASHGSAKETQDWVKHLQTLAVKRTGIPILFGADCEQGLPQSFSSGTELPWQMALGSSKDPAQAREAGRILGKEARAIGLDLVFGPCADVNTNPKNMVIMTRAFGADPKVVAELTAAFVEGLESQGVGSIIKHFPGHGATEEDTHFDSADDWSDEETIRSQHLPPFQAGFQAGASGIMTGHIKLHEMDLDQPATLSHHVLTGLLRDDMQFEGIVITDSLNMGAIRNQWTETEAAILSLIAGADIALHPSNLQATMESIREAVQTERLPMSRLNNAVQRILALKQKLLPFQIAHQNKPFEKQVDLAAHQKSADDIARSCITYVPGSQPLEPLETTPELLVVIDDQNRDVLVPHDLEEELKAAFPSMKVHYLKAVTSEETVNKIHQKLQENQKREQPLLVALMAPMMYFKGYTLLSSELSKRLKKVLAGVHVEAAIAFASPYILHRLNTKRKLCAYGPSICSQKAAAKVLLGEYQANHEVPVPWPGF